MWRQECNLCVTSNYPGIQIIPIRIIRDPPAGQVRAAGTDPGFSGWKGERARPKNQTCWAVCCCSELLGCAVSEAEWPKSPCHDCCGSPQKKPCGLDAGAAVLFWRWRQFFGSLYVYRLCFLFQINCKTSLALCEKYCTGLVHTGRATRCKANGTQMDGSVHLARKQHQRVCVRIRARASCVNEA